MFGCCKRKRVEPLPTPPPTPPRAPLIPSPRASPPPSPPADDGLLSTGSMSRVRRGGSPAGLGSAAEMISPRTLRQSSVKRGTPLSLSRKSSFRSGVLMAPGVSGSVTPGGLVSRASSFYLQFAASRTATVDNMSRVDESREDGEEGGGSVSSVDNVSFPRGMAKTHMFVFQDVDDRELDASRLALEWGDFGEYEVDEENLLGQGAYGEVYKATHVPSGGECVVKTIKQEKESILKIKKEIMMLKHVQGGPYIVKLLDLVRDPKEDVKLIVFEYLKNPNYKESFRGMSEGQGKWYLYRVLKALAFAHSMGVIHRDVKGGNILYDPESDAVRLIDWGFAEYYRPDKPLKSWPGTRPYKAPELFLHYPYYDYAVDVWAFACLMGSLIFRRTVFRSKDNRHQMELIARALGTSSYERYLAKYARPPYKMQAKKYRRLGEPHSERTGFGVYVSSTKTPLATEEALDLLDWIFVWDHEKRPTCEEVLRHPYFTNVAERSVA